MLAQKHLNIITQNTHKLQRYNTCIVKVSAPYTSMHLFIQEYSYAVVGQFVTSTVVIAK